MVNDEIKKTINFLKGHKKYQIQLALTFKICGRVYDVETDRIKGRPKKTMNQNS
jgi:hypothetical protein